MIIFVRLLIIFVLSSSETFCLVLTQFPFAKNHFSLSFDAQKVAIICVFVFILVNENSTGHLSNTEAGSRV